VASRRRFSKLLPLAVYCHRAGASSIFGL